MATPVVTATIEGTVVDVASFGPVLYEIDQKVKKNHFILRFHENFIVIYESEVFCCYPHGYKKRVLPRYSVIGAEIEKANVNKLKIQLGWVMFLAGLIAALVDEDAATQVKILGYLLAVVGAVLIIYPCIYRTYNITLKLMKETPAPTACLGLIKLPAPVIVVTVQDQPNDSFILDYVYGKLAGNMDGTHIAAHGISNHIFSPVQPGADLASLV